MVERVVERRTIGWDEARWLNPPPLVEADGTALVVTTGKDTDFWRTTGYGFVHDNGHALLTGLPAGAAVEVTFAADLTELYDQAGAMVYVDGQTWVKAGVELTDSVPHLGAVVTHGRSDWSLAPVPTWAGRFITLRLSRLGDALRMYARLDGEAWRMIRLAPLDPDVTASAGPYCCSPLREGLRVRFTAFRIGPAGDDPHAAAALA